MRRNPNAHGDPMLRVGRIAFANCTPIFMALEEEGLGAGVELVHGVPTDLNRMLDDGSVDVSPSSSVAWLRAPEKLGFLPDLSISSIGGVESVVLFSDVPLERLDGASVGLTPSSATSVVLLRILLEGFASVGPVYRPEPAECDAVLLIGDAALKESREKKWNYAYDLGKLWYEATSTPFVFALWLVRRDSFNRSPLEVRDLYRRLVAARQVAYRNYPRYSRLAPEAAWLGEDGLRRYWGTISYDLTAWHLAGLARFAAEARAMGLIESEPPLCPMAVEDLEDQSRPGVHP